MSNIQLLPARITYQTRQIKIIENKKVGFWGRENPENPGKKSLGIRVFFKFLSSWSFVKSRRLWDLVNIISLTHLYSWSNESSQQNMAEKPANFAGGRLLYTTLGIRTKGRRTYNITWSRQELSPSRIGKRSELAFTTVIAASSSSVICFCGFLKLLYMYVASQP